MDHRRGGAHRQPCLPAPRRRRAHRRRHRARRRPAPGRAPGRDGEATAARGGRSRLETPPAAKLLAPPGAKCADLRRAAAERGRRCAPRVPRSPISRAPAAGRPRRHAGRPRGAASTSCVEGPATKLNGSLVREAWSTSSWSAWRRACWASTASWPPSGRSRAWNRDLRWTSIERIGEDLRLIARAPGREDF